MTGPDEPNRGLSFPEAREALAPCPFCGAQAVLSRHPKGYDLAHCSAEECDPGHLTFAVPAKWNRRALPAPVVRMEWEHDRDCLYVISDGPAPCTCEAGKIAANPPAPVVTEEMVERACAAWFDGDGYQWDEETGADANRASMRAALTAALQPGGGE